MVGTGNIRHWLVWLVCMALLSCGRDSDPVAPNDLPGVPEGVTVGFRISLGSMGGTRAVQDGYDDGTGTDYENHIDFPNLDYRFLFFDMQNRYIASFVPTGIKPSNPGTVRSKTYEVTGKIEQALPEDFKVVALANWTSYPDAPVAGATTLEEICTSVGSRYEYTPPFRLGERLIPMYGVRRCEGVTFTQNMHTDLGTIHMLRAMAKIEVVCRTAGWTLDRVVMHRYNARGFCAPERCFVQEDYFTPDYTDEVHLVDGRNDADLKTFAFEKTDDGRFVAYVPEYRNVEAGTQGSPAADVSRLQVRFRESGQTEYPVEFLYYETPPAGSQTGDTFDLRRNYYYRFSITKAAEPKIAVEVFPYEQVELEPGFGIPSQSETK